jgi:hypothetical protein
LTQRRDRLTEGQASVIDWYLAVPVNFETCVPQLQNGHLQQLSILKNATRQTDSIEILSVSNLFANF